ncbi:Long-chain-fatty-acid--CoA ligase 5 [Gurleya vavrai]
MTIHDTNNNGVGIPFPPNQIKLIPTEDYSGNEGEICIRGNNVCKGYYKREELNDTTFKDGWLLTGDIASVKDETFTIIGRKKENFKTSYGEYIVPEKLENLLKGGVIEDILIAGRRDKEFIVAIVVCKNEKIDALQILEKLKSRGAELVKKNQIMSFEIPKKIHVIRQDFDSFGEMLTPTMKKKRSKIEKHFELEIDGLYDN